MAIQVKKEYSNGLFDVQAIYDTKHKILEQTNGMLWNTDKDHPIVIAKSRRADYVESSEPVI